MVKLGRGNSQNSRFFIYQPFSNHIDGDFYGRRSGPLAVSCLEHKELVFFDGKFDVLHILVMFFKYVADTGQLLVTFRHNFFHRRQAGLFGTIDRLGSANAGDHIFTLGVNEVFAIEIVLAGRGIAGECDAGGTIVTHVAINH